MCLLEMPVSIFWQQTMCSSSKAEYDLPNTCCVMTCDGTTTETGHDLLGLWG